jgi:DNA (cytosine-5)-methyltransferase 1
MENVVQMKSWAMHQELLDQLWELGYYVRSIKLNSKDFGVAQSRERLYLICAKTLPDSIRVPKRRVFNSASSILAKKDSYKYTKLYKDGRAKATLERAERAFDAIGLNTPFLLVYYGSDGSGGWQPLDKPLRTITTVDRFALVKPSQDGHIMRMLQPSELKDAMGYGKRFRFCDHHTRRDKVKLMGNGVCPPVMKEIVKSIV